MSPLDELARAGTLDDVLRATNDYLSRWTPQELGSLPMGCRPGRVRSRHDIEQWADRLLAACRITPLIDEDARTLDRMTSHFLMASVKIRRLDPRRPPRVA
ncbi:MAG TPA: hypothetical protein VLC53_14620 [Myxococcota bacterium]|nr:hypothetical protein [Myxococcota bacterium]